MMTCVSERSGRASTAMRLIDQRPANTSAAMIVSVMNLFVAQMRISFSIMRSLPAHRRLLAVLMGSPSVHLRERRFQPRLGIDEEVRLRDDLFTRGEAAAHFVDLLRLRADRDFTRLERAVAFHDEDDRARAGLQDRGVGSDHDLPRR